jgi:hypothetical protein
MAASTLIKLATLVCFATQTFPQARPQEQVNVLKAPDGTAAICWYDSIYENVPCRDIFVIDWYNCTLPLCFITFPRHTGAAWSSDSKKLAIFNAPDNANCDLWIGSLNKGRWSFEKVDISSEVISRVFETKQAVSESDRRVLRGGIYALKWSNDTWEASASYQNQKFVIDVYPYVKGYKITVKSVP